MLPNFNKRRSIGRRSSGALSASVIKPRSVPFYVRFLKVRVLPDTLGIKSGGTRLK
jgi:hypothetical protein